MTWLRPLVLTILFEVSFAYLLGIRKKDLLLVTLVNVVTNPVLVTLCLLLMYHIGIREGRILTYLILEPAVVWAEYLLYRRYMTERRNYLLLSMILNIVSITGGYLCQKLF